MKTPVVFVILQSGARANGGVQSVTEVMRRLRHHRPIVVTNRDSDIAATWRDLGIEVHVVAETASAGIRHDPIGTLRSYRRYRREIGDILDRTGSRVVHANDPLAFQLSLQAAKGRARIALNVRDTLDPARSPPRLKYRAMFAAADHVFYLSDDMTERWRNVAPNAARACSVTYSIVDKERFRPGPPPDRLPSVVLVPSIFWAKKGQLDFIRLVVPALAEQGIETWFAGDFEPAANPYAAACAEAAKSHSGQVKFLGYQCDLPELYRQANVIAVPSRHEGLMRGMIEAMSCARPVVSFDVCSAREVIEQKAGIAGAVVPLGDYDGMKRALLRYLADPQLQAADGRKARVAAEELFNAERVVERYEHAYQMLAAR